MGSRLPAGCFPTFEGGSRPSTIRLHCRHATGQCNSLGRRRRLQTRRRRLDQRRVGGDQRARSGHHPRLRGPLVARLALQGGGRRRPVDHVRRVGRGWRVGDVGEPDRYGAPEASAPLRLNSAQQDSGVRPPFSPHPRLLPPPPSSKCKLRRGLAAAGQPAQEGQRQGGTEAGRAGRAGRAGKSSVSVVSSCHLAATDPGGGLLRGHVAGTSASSSRPSRTSTARL